METYSLKIGLFKAFQYFALFALPVLVDKFVVTYPELAQLTLGAVLVALVNLLKVKYGFSFGPKK